MDRMEYIREKLAEFSALAERFVYQSYFSDVSYLLERIDKLERENERLQWFYENMRMADRLNMETRYEVEHKA